MGNSYLRLGPREGSTGLAADLSQFPHELPEIDIPRVKQFVGAGRSLGGIAALFPSPNRGCEFIFLAILLKKKATGRFKPIKRIYEISKRAPQDPPTKAAGAPCSVSRNSRLRWILPAHHHPSFILGILRIRHCAVLSFPPP